MKTRLLIAAAAALLASCATDPAAQAPDEKLYSTGSNIPRRDRGVHTMSPADFEHVRNTSSANTGKAPSN